MMPAGFWRRFAAFWLDFLPLTLLVVLLFYFFLGFDTTLKNYFAQGPQDLDVRFAFLTARNRIRNLSLVLYLTYCGIAEASPLRGTFGKWLLSIEVVGTDGLPLTRARAAQRNSAKVLSFVVFGLGCLWIAWSPTKQSWHDKLAGAFVVRRSARKQSEGFAGHDQDEPEA